MPSLPDKDDFTENLKKIEVLELDQDVKMITERKVPCRVHPGSSAVCRQWHKLKLEANLVASLISRDVYLRSTLLGTHQLYKVILALIIFCGF